MSPVRIEIVNLTDDTLGETLTVGRARLSCANCSPEDDQPRVLRRVNHPTVSKVIELARIGQTHDEKKHAGKGDVSLRLVSGEPLRRQSVTPSEKYRP